jgi:hypothetical protein
MENSDAARQAGSHFEKTDRNRFIGFPHSLFSRPAALGAATCSPSILGLPAGE